MGLGIEHPPNGEEFSIGCSLCRGSDQFYSIKEQIHQSENKWMINKYNHIFINMKSGQIVFDCNLRVLL